MKVYRIILTFIIVCFNNTINTKVPPFVKNKDAKGKERE